RLGFEQSGILHGGDGEKADIRARHEDLAVREIDHEQDAIDQRIAERDQRVDATLRQPKDEVTGETLGIVATRLNVVDGDDQQENDENPTSQAQRIAHGVVEQPAERREMWLSDAWRVGGGCHNYS